MIPLDLLVNCYFSERDYLGSLDASWGIRPKLPLFSSHLDTVLIRKTSVSKLLMPPLQ